MAGKTRAPKEAKKQVLPFIGQHGIFQKLYSQTPPSQLCTKVSKTTSLFPQKSVTFK
jgi:hypothetical protein